MKTLKYLLGIPLTAVIFTGCSDDQVQQAEQATVEFGRIELLLDDQDQVDSATRAVSDFAVNTGNDPTRDNTRLTGSLGWMLDVTIYDYYGNPYMPASGIWSYSGTSWVNSGGQLYLPSYIMPRVEAALYPVSENEPVATDQSSAADLLEQDILVQRYDSQYVTPAHIVRVEMRHKHSMLDFILDGVNTDDIASLAVEAGGLTYRPYNIAAIPNEYLVILPEGISDPVVVIETNEGARYKSTVDIASTQRNYCYCARLTGLQLALSSVTVVNWALGTALPGEYTTPASYPTFRGAPDITITLTYDNGLKQNITFNERGEATVQPSGRKIIEINGTVIDPPIILDKMYVDLTDYIL